MRNEVFHHLADNPVSPWYFSFLIKVALKLLSYSSAPFTGMSVVSTV
jgi:hypothetical protein